MEKIAYFAIFFLFSLVSGILVRHWRNRWQAWIAVGFMLVISSVGFHWLKIPETIAFLVVIILVIIGLISRNLFRGLCRAAENPKIWTKGLPWIAIATAMLLVVYNPHFLYVLFGRFGVTINCFLVLALMIYGFWRLISRLGHKKGAKK
ncbi:MAG: hypothetical protein NTV62_01990 [Candidatus Gribaldobacteria bacterium]|nr:hypothetical protein [Candidatus Gribaldobacteria bacterium]